MENWNKISDNENDRQRIRQEVEKELLGNSKPSTANAHKSIISTKSNLVADTYGFIREVPSDEEEFEQLGRFGRNSIRSNRTLFYIDDTTSIKSNISSKSSAFEMFFKSSGLTKQKSIFKSTSSLFGGSVEGKVSISECLDPKNIDLFAENLPIDVVRLRETKWMEMLNNYEEWKMKKYEKLKTRCRKGIPRSLRSRAWMVLSGAEFLKKRYPPNYFNECSQNSKNINIKSYLEDIKKDLHRQFPNHELFMETKGQESLEKVLKAYAVHNQEVGYCQAQGPIAALLLMHMPEEDSFWLLVQISDNLLKGYYSPGLSAIQRDAQVLLGLFEKENKFIHDKLVACDIMPVMFMTDWFMCIFVRTLPWCTVLRIWDMFFFEGCVVMFRVGLYLMKTAFSSKRQFLECQRQGEHEILSMLKNYSVDALKEANLVKMSTLVKVSIEDVKFMRKKCSLNKS